MDHASECVRRKFVYRKGECNEVADCISRNWLAARLVRIIKQVGVSACFLRLPLYCSGAVAGGISSQPEAREQVEKHHAEFKQLASQCNGDVGMFEVTLHHTVVRPEEEEVEIGKTEKDNDRFLECPAPAMRGARLSAPCAGPVNPSICR